MKEGTTSPHISLELPLSPLSPPAAHVLLQLDDTSQPNAGQLLSPRRRATGVLNEVGILSTLSSLFSYRLPEPGSSRRKSREQGRDRSAEFVVAQCADERGIGLNRFGTGLETGDTAATAEIRRARISTQSPSELPPSPLTIPGTWQGDRSADAVDTAGSLYLPPPFLDNLSSKDSFDGLFGSRAARQSRLASARTANLIARDRPPLPFPQALIKAASSLVAVLGPPEWNNDDMSSLHDGMGRTTRDGKLRTERAESATLGVELAERWIGGRVRRSIASAEAMDHSRSDERIEMEEWDIIPATPMSMFIPSNPQQPRSTHVSASSAPSTSSLFSPLMTLPPLITLSKLVPVTSELSLSPLPLTPLQLDSAPDFLDIATLDLDQLLDTAVESPSSQPNLPPAPHSPPRPSTTLPPTSSTLRGIEIGSVDHHNQNTVYFPTLVFIHLFGFIYFISIHSIAFLGSLYTGSGSTFVFLRWAFLNLTLRTELSIVAYKSYATIRGEWTKVGQEDGFINLGVTNIVVGLSELAAVHALSRRRYLMDGPGKLVLLNGEVEEEEEATREAGNRDPTNAGYTRPLPRRRSSRWDEEDDDGERLLVTSGEDSILSATIVNSSLDYATSPPPMPSSPPLRPLPPTRPFPALLRTIKRFAKFGAASYGLHSFILLPPSPLSVPLETASMSAPAAVTPSTLPQRIFSRLGQIDEKNVLHFAIQHNHLRSSTPPVNGLGSSVKSDSYAPAFYILQDDLHSEIVCVIRGTQSLSDIKTDLETAMVDITLPSLLRAGVKDKYRMHAGILATARNLLSKESVLLRKLVAALESHPGYSLVLTGHSLGGGIASAVALLISHYTPSTSDSPHSLQGFWSTGASSLGLPVDRPVRSYCFAHPATIDLACSQRCAAGLVPLVTSVSYGSDIVCRVGIPQICEIRRVLGRLAIKRRKFLQHRKDSEHGQLEILRSWWRWKALKATQSSSESLMEIARLEAKAWEWRMEVDQSNERQDREMYLPAGKCYHLDSLPVELEELRRSRSSGEELEEEDELPMGLYLVGNPAAFYSCPHLVSDAITSHLPRNYLDAIDALQ